MKIECQALSSGAVKCRNNGVWKVKYHGADDIYLYSNGDVKWVEVIVCKKHGEKFSRRELKQIKK